MLHLSFIPYEYKITSINHEQTTPMQHDDESRDDPAAVAKGLLRYSTPLRFDA